MQKTIITIATIAAACIGIVAVDEITVKGKKAAISNAKQKIINNRTDSDKDILKQYEDIQKKVTALNNLEESEIAKQINEYKESINYISRKEEISNQATKKVDEFKESIGYEDLRALYKKEFDDTLDAWKKENSFEVRINAEKAKIAEAEKVSQNQNFMTKIASADSEYAKAATEKLVETINETKEKAIKDANTSIKAIEKEFDDFKKNSKKEYDAKLNELSAKVNGIREEASKKSMADLKALETDVSTEAKKIRDKYVMNESEDMKSLRQEYTYFEGLIRQLNEDEERTLKELVSNITNEDIVASYFTGTKLGKVGTFSVLLIPTFPIIFAEVKMIQFALRVMNKMEAK